MEEQSPIPDEPVGFGYKCAWLAIRSDDPLMVITALDLNDVVQSPWKAGLDAAYELDNGYVFVSPVINGWVLAVSFDFPWPNRKEPSPDRCTHLLLALGANFSDVQYFATHRIVELHGWARIVNGALIRQYAWVGESLEPIWAYGSETREERALGMAFTDLSTITWPDDDEALDRIWEAIQLPGEGDVMEIAEAWSINPTKIEQYGIGSSLGYLGRLRDG